MLKLVNSQVVRKDNKYVVQKYIGKCELVANSFADCLLNPSSAKPRYTLPLQTV